MSDARYARDASLFVGANMNTVHPFCVIEGDGFYDACDRAGLLVYQDFPIWTMADPSSAFARAAMGQFDDMLDRLGRFASVAIWNFDSQPSIANVEKHCTALVRRARMLDPGRIAHEGNAAVAYEEHDDVHPVRSFFWRESEATRLERDYGWRRDNHMYPGWYFGDIEAITALPRSHFGLVTEFGAQALPDKACLSTFCDTDAAEIDWAAMAARCLQPQIMRKRVPDPADLDDLIGRSQAYQADLLKHHIEYIRSLKGAPCRGLHVFAFVDCWPSVTWSILDYGRNPKPAYHEVARSMRPVQVFLSDYRRTRIAGSHERLRFWVANDGREPVEARSLSIELTDAQGQARRFSVAVGALGTDRAQPVDIEAVFPETPGPCKAVVTLDVDGGPAVNEYVLTIAP